MKTILVLTDHSPAAEHAAVLAMIIAQHAKAHILVANVAAIANGKTKNVPEPEPIVAGCEDDIYNEAGLVTLNDNKILWNSICHLNLPDIKEIDISAYNEAQLAEFINKQGIWMVIKNTPLQLGDKAGNPALNLRSVLNKVCCPLLLVPQKWQIKGLARLVYIADLRYCRIQVVKYLAQLARAFEASVSVAHLSGKGMPDITAPFADDIFRDTISAEVEYEHISLDNIRERDMVKATDVLINGLHSDMLVFTNHSPHFEDIAGKAIWSCMPDHLTVPLLVFPD